MTSSALSWTDRLRARYRGLGQNYRIEVPAGWQVLITDLYAELAAILDEQGGSFAWQEVRLRRGALWVRFRVRRTKPATGELIERRIKLAIAHSLRTCTICGARGELWSSATGHEVRCPAHREARAEPGASQLGGGASRPLPQPQD